MTTITIDDELINNILAVSHYSHPQEAVEKILTDYLQLNVKPITRREHPNYAVSINA